MVLEDCSVPLVSEADLETYELSSLKMPRAGKENQPARCLGCPSSLPHVPLKLTLISAGEVQPLPPGRPTESPPRLPATVPRGLPSVGRCHTQQLKSDSLGTRLESGSVCSRCLRKDGEACIQQSPREWATGQRASLCLFM